MAYAAVRTVVVVLVKLLCDDAARVCEGVLSGRGVGSSSLSLLFFRSRLPIVSRIVAVRCARATYQSGSHLVSYVVRSCQSRKSDFHHHGEGAPDRKRKCVCGS